MNSANRSLLYAGQGNRLAMPWFLGFLAELEAEAGNFEPALTAISEGLASAQDGGQHYVDALLHRLRGDILLKRDLADPSPAEEAYRTAIAIAKQQGARSHELLASLALARLYQTTGRLVEAHDVLAPALKGFSPTPEMPEIAEAQALFAALAETDEVKAEAERRQRRQHLQVSYGNALIAARGFGAAETTEAFARARDAAYGEKDAPERLAADFGLWAGSYTRGELTSMRAHAAAFLADVAGKPDLAEAGIAYRCQGITSWFAGEYLEARDHLQRALATFQPGRDDELAYRFGHDPGVPAMAYLALVLWSIGEVDNALPLVERMRERIGSLSHANTLALGTMHASMFELMRGDRSRLRTCALELVRIVREHDLRLFRAFGEFLEGWATADGGALTDGLEGMRRGAESLREQNALVFDGLIKIALSEAEARAGDLERAIATLDEALATVERIGYRAFEAELRRARGEMLLRRDPADFAEGGTSAPDRRRRREAAMYAQLRTARGAVACQAVPIDRSPLRRPRRPRDRARRLRADAGDAGDRRGAIAARCDVAGGRTARWLASTKRFASRTKSNMVARFPFLHRLRGEILLKRDPTDPARAEEAFRTSIAIAKEQGARSPVLLASLPLAKLLQSTGRFVEAHAVLTAALEGFSPTPEMPRDRRGASVAGGAGGDRRGQGRRSATPAAVCICKRPTARR